MQPELPPVLNILFIARGADEATFEKIRAVAPGRVNIVNTYEDFGPEIARDNPSTSSRRQPEGGTRTPQEIEALVQGAHVIYMGTPFPKTLPRRAPNLLWGHFSFAGVSNLMDTDWWAPKAIVTSSRGVNTALPIAEVAMGAVFMFAKRLDVAVQKTLEQDQTRNFPQLKLIAGKTLGIVGMGGIGSHLARLAKGCGMRVVATRRSAEGRQENIDGVDVMYATARQNEMLAECDFVAICAMWTPETTKMIDAAAFAAMKPGAYLTNIARGELLDEEALADALRSGHLAGAHLDVWNDDMLGVPPSEALRSAPNIVYTPHASGRSDVPQGFSLDLFCDNLGKLIRGEPLTNVVDWERGY